MLDKYSRFDLTDPPRKRPMILGLLLWQELKGAAGAEGEVRMPVAQLHARMVGQACNISGGVVMQHVEGTMLLATCAYAVSRAAGAGAFLHDCKQLGHWQRHTWYTT